MISSSLLALVLTVPGAPPDGEPGAPGGLHEQYGFEGLLVSKLEDGVGNLTPADVDGDGRTDLAVVDNAHSKIEFLLQGTPEERPADEARVNALPDEVTFRREAFPVEEKVTALAIADVDRDGRGDVLYLGDSGKLTIAYRDEAGKYGRQLRITIPDASASRDAVRPVDLDRDGRLDVCVLAKNETHLLLQGEDGRFARREKLPNASKDPSGFDVVDVDGDGWVDLLYVEGRTDWPFRVRLGEPGLSFGPELRSRFAEIRSYAVRPGGEGRGAEVAAVRKNSGRLALLRFEAATDAASEGRLTLSALRSVPYEEIKNADQREELLADLDGDGTQELIVAEPSGARIVVHRHLLGGEGAGATAYPSFLGASRPRLGDVDGDGKDELVVAAPDEGAIGVAEIDEDGSIRFPRAVAIPGGRDLIALDVADTDGDGAAEIWVALGDGKGRSRKRALVRLDGAGAVVAERKLEQDWKTDPSDLWLVDVDRDAAKDVLLFVPREVPTILLADAEAEDGFRDANAAAIPGLGILEGRPRRALTVGDVDGDGATELVVPGPNFVRAFHLDADGKPVVVRQTNLANVGANVSRVQLVRLGEGEAPELLAVDESTSSLLVLDLDGTEAGRVDLGGVQPSALVTGDLDGDGGTELLVLAPERYAVVVAGATDPGFVLVDDLEVPVKDVWLDRIAIGDVNGDGAPDAVVSDGSGHRITLSKIEPERLRYALHWPVYEERIFERGGRGGREPREVAVGDFDGDDRTDIAILVHDRLIVYPQEAPR